MVIGPIKGKRVRDPRTKRIIEESTKVQKNGYWLRRIKVGDVELVSESDKVLKPKRKKPKADPVKEPVKIEDENLGGN